MMHFSCISLLCTVASIANAARVSLDKPSSNTGNVGTPMSPPVWPDRFEVSYIFEMPYVSSIQPGGLKEPVTVVYDGPASSATMDVYGDLDKTYFLPGLMYTIYPRISTKTCDAVNTTAGPTGPALGKEDSALPPPLPDISGWEYAGEAHLPGREPSVVWQLNQRFWEKASTYSFHVSKDSGDPMVLHMVGVDLLSGSHFDQYELTFTHFKNLQQGPKNAFVPPKICRERTLAPAQDTHHARRLQLLSLLPSSIVSLPSSRKASSGSSSGGSKGGRSGHGIHADSARVDAAWAPETWQQRIASALSSITGIGRSNTGEGGSSSTTAIRGGMEQARSEADLEFIHRWNIEVDQLLRSGAQGTLATRPSFKLSPNKFLSLPEKQWQAVALGRRPEHAKLEAHKPLRNAAHLGPFKRALRDDQLPVSVDWRGTPADGPVKDQATCGSCWAFASAGAMTGAWFLATGTSMSLSEQQLVDCSWDSGEYGNYGCGGGWQESALTYAASAGIASESDYEYLGQNGYCRENKTEKVARFKGFMTVPYKDEKAMMEVVATHGPLAISYDAADITMKYYSEGVYFRENCGTTADDLDHAVTLVGYGTTPDGVDYWLLRNSWSVMWGESGYFKVARKGNDCGITVDGVVAVVDSDAAAPAVNEDSARRIAAARAAAVHEAPAAGVAA